MSTHANIALSKDAYQSLTYNLDTGAEKAVDGLKSNLSHNGGQCALSGSGLKTATWRVDLGDISSIEHMTIYYRTENSPWECNGGVYGQDCGNTCGSCINDTLCHHVNGSCLLGCGPGYKGDKCTEECPLGTYGNDCKYNCGIACSASNHCNKTTGECIGGCKPGWKIFFCKEKCDGGTYGQDCRNTCGSCINNTQCHHVNGSCLQGCGPGYHGDKCTEECPFGKYGINCQFNCSTTCNEVDGCSKTTGECIRVCKPGWKGIFCQRECDGDTYGQDCSSTCGSCINDTQCHHIYGICLEGCSPGYHGLRCEEDNLERPLVLANERDDEHNIYISTGVCLTIVILGTILNILIWKRKRQNLKNSSNELIKGHELDKQEKPIPSTYAELGDIDKHHTYDDIHKYSEANYSK
uniref:Multiple epidermal growth factor-like domains protein 10 n=1 Tax=Crassostrea virginica TaxID=6565 RepID=A0A8B8BBU8_CRAVI|nr:multiple epidermal growth factor-like domains protein 10 [Crassostrea virginica]